MPLQGKLRTLLDNKAGDQPWQWQEMPAGLGLATRGETSPAPFRRSDHSPSATVR